MKSVLHITILSCFLAGFAWQGCAIAQNGGAGDSSNVMTTTPPSLSSSVQVSFAEGSWDASQWTQVKSARWDNRGGWLQRDGHIENTTPQNASPAAMEGIRAPETYSSMVWNASVGGNFTVVSTMEFDYQMAPLIVLAGPLGAAADGFPEFREHWEVVLWNEGINVWHHQFADGKPIWHLAASMKHPFEAKTRYRLEVAVKRLPQGAEIAVTCGDASFTYMEHELPETVLAGITGCEGINRFYDFKIIL